MVYQKFFLKSNNTHPIWVIMCVRWVKKCSIGGIFFPFFMRIMRTPEFPGHYAHRIQAAGYPHKVGDVPVCAMCVCCVGRLFFLWNPFRGFFLSLAR